MILPCDSAFPTSCNATAPIQNKKHRTPANNTTGRTLITLDGGTEPQPLSEQNAARTAGEAEDTSPLHTRIEDLTRENNRLRHCLENQVKIANEALAREQIAIKANRELHECLKPLRSQAQGRLEMSGDVASLVQEEVARQIEGMRNR